MELYHSLLFELGVKECSFQDCYDDFRFGLLTSLVINVIAGPNIDPALFEAEQAANEVSAGEALFIRLGAAIDAYNVLEVVPASAAACRTAQTFRTLRAEWPRVAGRTTRASALAAC